MTGGFGSGVLELIEEARLADPAYREVAVRIVGIPGDRFVDHGSVADLRRVLRLDAPGLADQVRETLSRARGDTPGRLRRSVTPATDRQRSPRRVSSRCSARCATIGGVTTSRRARRRDRSACGSTSCSWSAGLVERARRAQALVLAGKVAGRATATRPGATASPATWSTDGHAASSVDGARAVRQPRRPQAGGGAGRVRDRSRRAASRSTSGPRPAASRTSCCSAARAASTLSTWVADSSPSRSGATRASSSMERTNARDADRRRPCPSRSTSPSIDVSFISLDKVLGPVAATLAPERRTSSPSSSPSSRPARAHRSRRRARPGHPPRGPRARRGRARRDRPRDPGASSPRRSSGRRATASSSSTSRAGPGLRRDRRPHRRGVDRARDDRRASASPTTRRSRPPSS